MSLFRSRLERQQAAWLIICERSSLPFARTIYPHRPLWKFKVFTLLLTETAYRPIAWQQIWGRCEDSKVHSEHHNGGQRRLKWLWMLVQLLVPGGLTLILWFSLWHNHLRRVHREQFQRERINIHWAAEKYLVEVQGWTSDRDKLLEAIERWWFVITIQ